ncbi:hypothetical protein [Bacillus marasmi]|uniref:hypothetical protein n=1 Tax=Bacillus marasmi TaxID=1926279 RepID=UPI0011C78AEE|nr:hypothetical protein [Bacillus marasmi]
MLKPSSDRLDYSNMLTPPTGYETSFAIGTTYSLDLNTLIGISIALGLSESIDSALKNQPIYLLEALKRTADKVLIFCEGGQIKAPANPSPLHILLEKMVVEVKMKNKKSFHPKFWFVKYENEDGDALYRCLILSRNLTFDRSWDVAVGVDGVYKPDGRYTNGYPKSKPISDFLKSLLKLAGTNAFLSDKRKMVSKLSSEVLDVKFELHDKRFLEFDFCPVGIAGYDIDSTGLFQNFHELLILSPFLSDEIILDFNKNALTNPHRNTLITRRSELPRLRKSSVTHFDVFVMKDEIVDGEEALSEGEQEEEKLQQDIHAKVYCKTKYANSELYIGSLNASTSASYGNVEFMLKLAAKRRYVNVDILKHDLFGDNEKENPFEKVEISDQVNGEVTDTVDLQKLIKDVSRLTSSAKVLENEDHYDLEITFENLINNENISISPLFSKQRADLSSCIRFTGLYILQLSEFYVIEAVGEEESLKRIIKIPTSNIPEARESSIVNEIIKDKNGFIQYLSFLLGDDYLLAFLENKHQLKNSFIYGFGEPIPALYEKMLRAAAHSPGKLDEIQKLMELISDEEIIPDGFRDVYDVFAKAVKGS